VTVTTVNLDRLVALRTIYRAEFPTQLVHDSIRTRPGWTVNVLLTEADEPCGFSARGSVANRLEQVGFATVAIAGPWAGTPTLLEYFVVPAVRHRALVWFDDVVRSLGIVAVEMQTVSPLVSALVWSRCEMVTCEKIVLRHVRTTAHAVPGASLVAKSDDESIVHAISVRSGGPVWGLVVDGVEIGRGGFLCHYNEPYADIHMEIDEPFRRRGFGRYLVQELGRLAYQHGQIPAARCGPTNAGSLATLIAAGFEPCSTILAGPLRRPG
jgi:GNAT superfamily N-acetyltransferase